MSKLTDFMGFPVSADENGINMKPELMEKETLYHCIFKNKAILVFKDSQEMLNCYEIEEESLVESIKKCQNGQEVEKIFQDYIKDRNITN